MKNIKKLFAIITAVGVIGTAGAAFAASVKTPADIAAELTGRTVEQVYEEKADGKTFGAIASDAGKLEEFKQQMLENKKSILDQRVEEGLLTQEEADEIYNNLKENIAACDGSGAARIGKANGVGFGSRQGMGMGKNQCAGKNGAGMRNGRGNGYGCGMGNGRELSK